MAISKRMRITLKQESICKTSKNRENARYWRWFDEEELKGRKPPIWIAEYVM
jgi:hypothetical protein